MALVSSSLGNPAVLLKPNVRMRRMPELPLLRSLLFVPGNQPRMLEKALTTTGDALVLDLEDSVPPEEKEAARNILARFLPHVGGDRTIFVRVNGLQTEWTDADLAAVSSPNLSGISIGKLETPQLAVDLAARLTTIERANQLTAGLIRVIPWIETAKGVMNVQAIAAATDRLAALAFGAEDFTADMGIPRTATLDEVAVPRSLVAIGARAAGLLALDTPDPDFKDLEHLARESRQAKALGYQGKFAIHPNQLETINAIFQPSAAELAYARRVVDVFEAARRVGKASIALDGKMVDIPVWKRALRLLESAQRSAR